MWNYPLPKTYLSKRMLPPHARVMFFFDTMEVKHHQCAMYTLYNSDKFSKAAYNHEKNYWLVVLQVKEQEASCHVLHKRNCNQRRHILVPGEHQRKKLRKGIQNVPNLLKLVCMIPRMYTTSVWFQKSRSGL